MRDRGKPGSLANGSLARLLPVVSCAVGLVMAFHPTLASGFGRVQTDPVDPRLINYMLEHNLRWATGRASLWNPPIFHPARNIAAYSDLLLSTAPPYLALRGVGLPPDTAYQVWTMLALAVDFAAGYLLLRRGMRLGRPGATAGAFLFAFGAPRVNQLEHPQLLPHAFTALTLHALLKVFEAADLRRAAPWIVAAVLGIVAELYGAFYPGWFFLLAGLLALPWVLALPGFRRPLLREVRRDWPAILAALALGAILLGPLAAHYLAAARELGGRRSFYEVSLSIPDGRTWFYLGTDSWLYGWMFHLSYFRGFGIEQIHRQGCGLATTSALLAGLALGWGRPPVRLAGLVGGSLILVATMLPNNLVRGAGLAVFLVLTIELGREPRPSGRGMALGALAVVLGGALFPPPVALMGLGLLVALAIPTAILRLQRRTWARVGPLLGAAAFLIGTTTEPHHAWALLVALLGPLALLAERLRGWTPPRLSTLTPLTLGLAAGLTIFRNHLLLWNYVYWYVPGGGAIRAVGRIGLIVLIPASLGVALLFDRLASRRRYLLAAALGLVCALEQGITSPSFDKQARRDAVAAVARRIDPRAEAFYASPHNRAATDHTYQLDAMWAGLARGVPTLNGYSGAGPPGWGPLEDPCLVHPNDVLRLRAALRSWCLARQVRPERVQWIGGPAGGLGDNTSVLRGR